MAKGVGGGSPANVAKYLKGIDFPISKEDLINQAKKNHAEEPVLQELKKMPEQEYGTSEIRDSNVRLSAWEGKGPGETLLSPLFH